ncbi:retrovirus-related Pol polyprotein from transposon 412 [Trichonephila inaurata madagascariensis]|uniref:Retrovirus-related Pol polyprotein from transposon 412 n=1 Tax=Trichonephila inaurata madagascariensis TaxID=2747483 RepID=A0A8X6ILC4_9ARAC|nr:retrovirus-related Pol polyprotein from transposon 412 [Trichonephila inaurata madagascariensis]
MTHGNSQLTIVLPNILMGFSATWKEDLQATTAEMIYGAPIRLPDEFLCLSKSSADPVTFVGRLRESMQCLSPPTTRHDGQHTIFVSKDLATCNDVCLLKDSLRKGLQPPYEGPYKVVDRTEKMFRIVRHGKEMSVSIDSLKPDYISKELTDFPVEVNLKEKVSLQTEENQGSEQEKPTESSSRQETTTRPYKVVDRTEKVFSIVKHGKEMSVSIDSLKPAYIPKVSEDFPVEVNMKEKVSLQPEENQGSEQEKPRESSSRQDTTTHSGRRVPFNPKYS